MEKENGLKSRNWQEPDCLIEVRFKLRTDIEAWSTAAKFYDLITIDTHQTNDTGVN